MQTEVLLILDFPCLAKFLFLSYCPKCSGPIRLQDSLKCNISKKMMNQVNLLFADKRQSFLQVGAIAFGGCGKVCPK